MSIVDSEHPLLAVRLPNWVGDVVMALPTIVQLQRSGFELRLVGRGWAKDLLEGCNLPVQPTGKGVVALARVLKLSQTDRGLLFTNSLSSALAMRMAGISAIGYKADCRSWLLHMGLQKVPGRHEVDYFWRLGEAANACWGSNLHWPAAPPKQIQLPIGQAHIVAASKAINSARIGGPYLVCCPMAAGTTRGQSKQWPHFSEFCRALSDMGQTVVICPGPGEMQQCQQFSPHATVLPGLSLGVYAAILAGAKAVVANDSGPMHLAAAVGAPVLGIFGSGDPVRTCPWGGQFIGGIDGWPTMQSVLAAFDEMVESHREAQIAPLLAA